MRASWHAIHAELLQSTTHMTFRTRFKAIQVAQPRLHSFPDPGGLLDRLHAPGGDPAEKNQILRALITAAQNRSPEADAAVILLLLALWPGMDAVRGRLRRHVTDPDELASELLARATLAIRIMDLSVVNRIAATLLMNLERDITRALGPGRREAPGACPAEDMADFCREGPMFMPLAIDHQVARVRVHEIIANRIGTHSDLVMAVAVDGFTEREAAEQLGISYDAARKRYQRALGRLRSCRSQVVGELSQIEPRLGFSQAEAADGGAADGDQDA